MRMFCKKDLIVMIAAVIAIAVSAIAASFYQKNEGDTIRITIDGVLYGEYSLAKNQTVTMDEKLGHNKLVIEDGSAYMAEADCADKYCMAYKPISKSGETIICLPHRLVAEVTGDKDSQLPDVIVP
ncbi:MAG: NusG domain II-containing protein [Lachnospiraceae bacterium]|nr:NusG domain II-containing protein [Lachnospiraceae bacterium]MDE7184904.1 NusG domain II-containing protein [Lachnospiraceae bacterium]